MWALELGPDKYYFETENGNNYHLLNPYCVTGRGGASQSLSHLIIQEVLAQRIKLSNWVMVMCWQSSQTQI